MPGVPFQKADKKKCDKQKLKSGKDFVISYIVDILRPRIQGLHMHFLNQSTENTEITKRGLMGLDFLVQYIDFLKMTSSVVKIYGILITKRQFIAKQIMPKKLRKI